MEIFGSKKNLGRNFYRVKRIWVGNFIGLKKIWVGNFIGLKKIWVGNFKGLKKLGWEFYGVKKNYRVNFLLLLHESSSWVKMGLHAEKVLFLVLSFDRMPGHIVSKLLQKPGSCCTQRTSACTSLGLQSHTSRVEMMLVLGGGLSLC